MKRGELWWAGLPRSIALEPGYRRPVLIVQSNDFNRSRINTVVVVSLTSNLRLEAAPGNLLLSAEESGLPRDLIVNVSQPVTLDRSFLTERIGYLETPPMRSVKEGLRTALDL